MAKFRAEHDDNQKRIDTGLSNNELFQPVKKIYEKVVLLCKEKPVSKGDYRLLTTYYYWKYHFRKFGLPFDELRKLPSPESITRAFRKAVENGDIEPTEKMLLRREQREKTFRKKIKDLGVD